MLETRVMDLASDELFEILATLPTEINPGNILHKEANITVGGAEAIILGFLRDDYDDEYHGYSGWGYLDDSAIDRIFDR